MLLEAVEHGLRAVNLWNGGAADKQARWGGGSGFLKLRDCHVCSLAGVIRAALFACSIQSTPKPQPRYHAAPPRRAAPAQARMYSGGMKRRLSVAISFVGDPLVVYLDEPSTVGVGFRLVFEF